MANGATIVCVPPFKHFHQIGRCEEVVKDKVPVIVEVRLSKSPNNIITKTFSLKKLTVRTILVQVNLEAGNIVRVRISEKPDFDAKFVRFHGHVLLE